MHRTALIAATVATAGLATATAALAADGSAGATRPGSPSGLLQLVLRPQSFDVAGAPQKHAQDRPPAPGTTSVTTYRVFDAAGAKRVGRAQFVCVSTDRRGRHMQCSGTIALRDGQIAIQGELQPIAVTGGTGAYAGARGSAVGTDHRDRTDVSIHFVS